MVGREESTVKLILSRKQDDNIERVCQSDPEFVQAMVNLYQKVISKDMESTTNNWSSDQLWLQAR